MKFKSSSKLSENGRVPYLRFCMLVQKFKRESSSELGVP
jgi:hypothetical protein